MRLLLLRHGQTHSNVAGALDTGHPGADLTDLGRAQAEAAARVLADRPIDAIHVSTLIRTHQTAAPLAATLGLEPVGHEGLREIRAGDREMSTEPDDARAFISVVDGWIRGQHDQRMPGGEDGAEFLARFDEVIERVRASGATYAVVVAHGAAIRTWLANRAVDHDDEGWIEHASQPIRNTGGIELEETDDGWRIVEWSNEPLGGHLLADPSALDPTAS